MLDMIRHAIISTDLVLYFENKKNVENWIQEGVIDIEHNAEHRYIISTAVIISHIDFKSLLEVCQTNSKRTLNPW